MAKEPDQTRWVGIRPTDPAENIPVTESAPLTAIQVEPKPGSANFPVTESAPLTAIQVEPKPGSANFPVTESAPLTNIRVQPILATTEFKTLTEKRSPAIADIQAPDDTIRVFESFTVTVAGTNTRLLYQCPVGKCAVIQHGYAYSNHGDPNQIFWIVKVGVQNYTLWTETHAAWGQHAIKPELFLKAGDYFGVLWKTCIIGNVLQGTVLGYEIDQY